MNFRFRIKPYFDIPSENLGLVFKISRQIEENNFYKSLDTYCLDTYFRKLESVKTQLNQKDRNVWFRSVYKPGPPSEDTNKLTELSLKRFLKTSVQGTSHRKIRQNFSSSCFRIFGFGIILLTIFPKCVF